MEIRNTTEAKDFYRSKIEDFKDGIGYSLTANLTKSGWVISKWYQRNAWVDEKLERKILIRNDGKIFENGVEIILNSPK